MNFSSLKYSDFSWTAIPIYDSGGTAVTVSLSANILRITNLSGSNRVYSVNRGAPFPVATGTCAAYDLATNGRSRSLTSIEYSAATLNSHYVDGV